jgi:Zn-dependent peptidase ImmA (M78 family)
MTRVVINRSILDWALKRTDNPAAVERKFPKLSRWLQGEAPTLRQLEAYAKATFVPLGYFFLPKPPEEQFPIPYFRTLDNDIPYTPSTNLIETVQIMERRQAWMREYLIERGYEPLPFVGSVKLGNTPTQIAQEIRRVIGVQEEWASNQPTWTSALRDLMKKAEDAGILVAVSGIVGNNTRRKLDTNDFRGFVLVDEYAPLVFINGTDGKAAQMFTLAHELAHIWLGSSAAFDLRELRPADDETEQTCNRVAAEFLVPESRLREFWNSAHQDPELFQAIARRFKVSELVAARRALDLGLIKKDKFIDFYNTYLERERKTSSQEGGNFYATQNLRLGRRFGETVVQAVKEGRLLYREAYRLTGLYGKTFEQYVMTIGSGGR